MPCDHEWEKEKWLDYIPVSDPQNYLWTYGYKCKKCKKRVRKLPKLQESKSDVDPWKEEIWDDDLLPIGTKIKIGNPYFLKSVWMHDIGKIAEIRGIVNNHYEVTTNDGKSWFWIPFEFAEKIV